MERLDAIERLQNVVRAWEGLIAGYPPLVAAEKTTLVVMRQPDIDAIKLALECLRVAAPASVP